MEEPYTARSVAETGSINVVTAILMDYRAFDTLGEATVIFASVAVAAAILGKPGSPSNRTMGLLSRRQLSALLPLFFIFPLFVIFHGHLSPGGGFQGGVSLAVLVILIHVAFGDRFGEEVIPHRILALSEYGAAIGLVGIGFVGIFQGSAYLANVAAGFPRGTAGTLASGGVIPLLNLLVGMKVAAGLSSIYVHLAGHEAENVPEKRR
ncbi:MAG: sodium:proton antiporter [Spirochaetaceae bacterium]|nr:MAG: sodium:proton antiporter [Spirochaetaceae bacterium]